MKLPKITIIPVRRHDPIVKANGEVLRLWRPRRMIDGERIRFSCTDACRMVYLIQGRWVLKVDRNRIYLDRQAGKEIRTWRALDEEDRPHFCPLLAWQAPRKGQRGWVLQPRLRFRPGPMPLWGWRRVLELTDKYYLRDFKGCDPNSPFRNNWGMVTMRGRAVPVIYDYGY